MSDLEKSQADNSQAKPEPICIGVSGFTAFLAEPEPVREVVGIDWAYLIGLPPFEMYLHEQTGSINRKINLAWLDEQIAKQGEQVVYDDYAKWHTDKGYWANETPMGEIKGE